MKVLQICNKPPFPPADGGAIAMGNMTRCLVMNGYEVTVLSMVSFKHESVERDFPEALRQKVKLHFAPVDLRLKPVNAMLNLFSTRSYHAERFYSRAFAEKLLSLLKSEQFDIIQLETIFPMVYHDLIRKNSDAKIILRLHNIEHEIWNGTAEAETHPFRKYYMRLLAKRLKNFELKALQQVDGIMTISSADLQRINLENIPKVNIPLSLDLSKYNPQSAHSQTPCLFHLGAMDWIPNQVGMRWFLDTAWKELAQQFPALKFHIAGRKMPDDFFNRQNNQLIVEGEVDEQLAFIRSKDIMVVPLLSGSGLRVKIIEGLALGKAIISTSIGAAGIDYTDGENILIADTPELFTEKISLLLNNPEKITAIGLSGRKLAEEKYSMESIAKKTDEFLKEVVYHSK